MERSEHARELFLSGHNCAQSVILSFADGMRFSKELAEKIAAGFGGGMGKQQETCGAVTGAIMVLGMKRGERVNNSDELKKETYNDVRELTRRFVSEFGSSKCRDLVGVDLNTPEGSAEFNEKKIKEHVCADCVKKAVQIVETIP